MGRASGIQQRGPPLWEEPPEQSPHKVLAEKLEVKLIIRIVAPEVSLQAVDQRPITITNPPRTVGPGFAGDPALCDFVVIGLKPAFTAFLLHFPITALMHETAPISIILGHPFVAIDTVAAIEVVAKYWLLPSHFLDHGQQFSEVSVHSRHTADQEPSQYEEALHLLGSERLLRALTV